MILPRDTSHTVQKQHKVVQSHTNNIIKATLSLVMGYEPSSPAQITFPSIPQLSNIAIIGAISARGFISLDISKSCAFTVKYKESVSSLSKLMLNASLCNKEPESASETLCMECGDLSLLEVYLVLKTSHRFQHSLETILLAVSAERWTAQVV